MLSVNRLTAGIVRKQKGFTLIEALISASILTISLLGSVAMMVYFGSETSDKTLKNCLLDTAVNALSQYRANVLPISSPVTCDVYSVAVSVNQGSFPTSGSCLAVTATASANGKSTQISSNICNY